MERSENKLSVASPARTARKLGLVVAAAMLLPTQVMGQAFFCGSGVVLDAQGQEPFFVNERIPIIMTLEAETVNNGTEDGVLHIQEFDFKPDCQSGTSFDTCVDAGNTVLIATPDDEIGGSCGASFSTDDLNDTTIRFTPDDPIVLASNTSCTVEFDVYVAAAPAGTPVIYEAGGWAETQVACFTTDDPPVAYPPLASSSASGQLSFQISTQRAEFRVTKFFVDQSDTNTANVHIECNAGFPLKQEFTLDHLGQVWFVVKEFSPGTLSCNVWEDPVPSGYSVVYSAGDQGGVAGSISDSANGCTFERVETGVFTCDVINEVDQVEITVNKQWTEGLAGTDLPFPLEADARYTCYDVFTSPDGAGGVTNVEGSMTFSGEFDSYVITGVYPSSRDSYCTVTEVNVPEEWVIADDSDCARVPVLSGAECTILNSAFFEGIPTMSQYGMAILALLMLGIGAVGFRRFA